MAVKIIRINDAPITTWEDSLELPQGEIGEIAVRADHATRLYFNRPESTTLAKIPTADGGFYHRMGDVGYVDERGRIWFCGRKSHRVETAGGTMFTIPCEAIVNTHPAVFRSALVGVVRDGEIRPVMCVELEAASRSGSEEALRRELLELASKHPHTQTIKTVLFHPSFPVDIRHNAKIFREKLAVWADGRIA